MLHGFKYTSGQWKNLVKEQRCVEDAEHDFVVLLQNKTVICIEVKRPNDIANIGSAYKAAVKQLDKFERFFGNLRRNVSGALQYTIFKFCVFSAIEKNDVSDTDKEKIKDAPILWNDDLKDFRDSLQRFGVSFEMDVDVLPTVSAINSMMVSFWLENCSGLKEYSHAYNPHHLTGKVLKNLNNQLKSQEIYCKAQNRSKNLVSVSKQGYKEILKEYHNIQCITEEQRDVLEIECESPLRFKKPYLFVNGSAGSGKTLIMQTRILKLLQSMGSDQ